MIALSLALMQAPPQKADTVAPAAAVESPFVATSTGWTLYGTLTVPKGAKGPVPVILIVAGSGPTDRNANSPAGVRSNAYAQLAWRLAEQGIGSLRYDKRGIAASRGAMDSAIIARTTMQDYANDVRNLADTLHKDHRFSKVILVGHSEGSALSIMAAHDGAPVAGVVSMAGMGRPFGVVLREQLAQQLDTTTVRMYDTSMTAYLAGRDPPVPSYLASLFVPALRNYIRSMMAFDPKEVGQLHCPVLVLQGDYDVQISVADAEALHAADPSSKLVVLPGDTHMFKPAASKDRMAQVPAYTDPTLPIDPKVVSTITDWIKQL
ncbi:MAG TPA: alpha/beta fold hydrolase [Gemmatimonadales bacterium]|nr:alpha/beta fold hydrolase [Gemmatimonadales bacterium]